MLQQLNLTHCRAIPQEAPTDFVTMEWWPYVVAPDGHIDRHYYELCTLWELRGALRAGNVWVPSSLRYANPETYLIRPDQLLDASDKACMLQIPGFITSA